MDNQRILSLAKAENLDVGKDGEYLLEELNEWLKALCDMFGEVVYE